MSDHTNTFFITSGPAGLIHQAALAIAKQSQQCMNIVPSRTYPKLVAALIKRATVLTDGKASNFGIIKKSEKRVLLITALLLNAT